MDCMVTMDDAKVFKSVIDVISFLIDETYIKFSKECVKINAMDSSHVAMLISRFPKALFSGYEYNSKNKEVKVGINVGDFNKILQRAKSSDTITLKHEGDENNELVIQMTSPKSTRKFKLKGKAVSDFNHDEDKQLELFGEQIREKFTVSFDADGDLMNEIISDAAIMSDLVKITVNEEKKLLFTANSETGDLETEIDLSTDGENWSWNADVKEAAGGMYSISFLENLIKVRSVVDIFRLFIGESVPLGITSQFKTADDVPDNEAGTIDCFLAPRVEDDPEDEEDDVFDDEIFDEEFD